MVKEHRIISSKRPFGKNPEVKSSLSVKTRMVCAVSATVGTVTPFRNADGEVPHHLVRACAAEGLHPPARSLRRDVRATLIKCN